jgi:hypothetical protein
MLEVAETLYGDTHVVGHAVPLTLMTAPLSKPLPFRVMVTRPSPAAAGSLEKITGGANEAICTDADAETAGFTLLMAVT